MIAWVLTGVKLHTVLPRFTMTRVHASTGAAPAAPFVIATPLVSWQVSFLSAQLDVLRVMIGATPQFVPIAGTYLTGASTAAGVASTAAITAATPAAAITVAGTYLTGASTAATVASTTAITVATPAAAITAATTDAVINASTLAGSIGATTVATTAATAAAETTAKSTAVSTSESEHVNVLD